MKTCVLVALCLLVYLTASLSAPAGAQEVPELGVNSKRYIVLDAETGEIYAQRGAHDQAAMASLTKIFTAIEAIESARSDYQITTSEDDLVSPDNSMMGFGPDETFTLEELLYGLMLPSGNDAANAIARSLGAEPGDDAETARQRFVDRMNTRIANMGLTNTYLVNPSGWGVPGHYSSAYDLAVFTMYALQYPRFVQVFSTLEYTTANGGYELRNNNRLMTEYSSLLGGKTGFDYDAGWCLIEVARRDGSTMISVTMDGIHPDDWYDDNRVLLEYAFEQKANRLAAGAPISGEVATFRDPDAAVIAQIATSGASVGAALPAPPAAIGVQSARASSRASAAEQPVGIEQAGDAEQPASAEPRAVTRAPDPATLVQGQSGPNWQLVAAAVVGLGIVAGSALFTFSQPAVHRAPATGGSRPRRLGLPSLGFLALSSRRDPDPV